MNHLGSCKHIERTLQFIQHRRKRAFAHAADAGSPLYEVFMDVRGQQPRLSLRRPVTRRRAVENHLAPLFDDAGLAVGKNVDAWRAIERVVAAMSARSRGFVRMSLHADYLFESNSKC